MYLHLLEKWNILVCCKLFQVSNSSFYPFRLWNIVAENPQTMKRAYAFQQEFFFCSGKIWDKSPHKQNICSDNLAISGLDFTNTEGRVNIYRRLQNLGLIFFFGYKNTLHNFKGLCPTNFAILLEYKNQSCFFPFSLHATYT